MDGEELEINDPAIEAADAPEAPAKKSLRDRMKAIMLGADATIEAAAPKAPRGKKAQMQQEFVDSLAPLLALLIAAGMHGLIAPPFKPIAPTQPEADSMVRPLVRILSRRLAVGGKISPDTIDLLLALASIALYAQRAHSTYQAIYQEGLANGSISPRPAAQRSARETAPIGRGAPGRGDGQRQSQPRYAPGHQHDPGEGSSGDSGNTGSTHPVLSDLLRADADGRRKRGLN